MQRETEWGTHILRSETESCSVRTIAQSQTKRWGRNQQGDGKGGVVGWGSNNQGDGKGGMLGRNMGKEYLPWRSRRRLFVRWRGGVFFCERERLDRDGASRGVGFC
jgi:hypothetical protein